jgi:ABC-type antimicrobial peptide transport system permease subunit
MFIKNLFRRKIRTALTIFGIALGVSAILSLGALANGLDAGYNAMLKGSKADLVLSQPNTMDITYSSIDEEVGKQLAAAPEVAEISGMIQGFTQTEGEPMFFVFGHPEDSFALGRFQIIEGVGLDSVEVERSRGKPILLGSAAAEVLDKTVGDSLRLTGSVYRVVGIYQTGAAFEDSGALLRLRDAQELLGKQRKVSLYYIRLKDPSLSDRFLARVKRQFPDLSLSGVEEFADNQAMSNMMRGYVWAIGGLAIVIGGVGMMNAQLMSVMERTREIGVLRAVGWTNLRVLWMILMESLSVCLLGGLAGLGIAYLLISAISRFSVIVGLNVSNIETGLLAQAFFVVVILGMVGGLYPAWRASRLQPVEALRYEGGSGGSKVRRLPFGGMAMQSLWQRSARTFLTLAVIGLTVGAIMALQSMVNGLFDTMKDVFAKDAEIIIRQADIADTSLSSIDERVGAKIAAMPEIKDINPVMFTAVMLPESGGFFIIEAFPPSGFAIRRFNIVEGGPLTSNHQIIIGRSMAEAMKKEPGDTIELSGTRFSVVGIYETDVGWEELGGVMTLRDAQVLMGKPRKVTLYAVKVHDPDQAEALVEHINSQFPDVHAALAGEFINQMPDKQNSDAMMNAIYYLAILVGGVGVLNAMLMSVFERTREIGVLRALGWRRWAVLSLILREAILLGTLGGLAGIGLAIIMMRLLSRAPMVGEMLQPRLMSDSILQAILVALLLGLIGGLYPAFRATRLQPVEALRYE